MSRFTKVFRNQGGFTLIELLIVVGIIGILAAIIIPNFTDLFARADESAARSDLRTLQTEVTSLIASRDDTWSDGVWGDLDSYEKIDQKKDDGVYVDIGNVNFGEEDWRVWIQFSGGSVRNDNNTLHVTKDGVAAGDGA